MKQLKQLINKVVEWTSIGLMVVKVLEEHGEGGAG